MEFKSGPGVQDMAPFSVTMEVEEDIEQEIENFVRFKRRGEYSRAQEIFQQTLCRHLSLFPVIAEYADLLLEEGKYQILSEFLDIQIQYMESILEDEEVELLRIMRSLVRIHTQGSLRSALIQAKSTWDFLCRGNTKIPSGRLPGDVEIHIYEIYVKILVFALTTSNWVERNDLECPWVLRKSADRCDLVQWYEILSHNGQFGNASNILSILLEILPWLESQDATVLFGKRCFGDLGELESFVGRYETENLLIFTVSLHRAQALLCLAVFLYKEDPRNCEVEEIYDLALSYHIVAGKLPAMIFPDDRPSLAHLRLKVQEVSFKRFEKQILSIDHPPEFLETPVRDFPVSLLESDSRCYTTCYMEALLRSYHGYTDADDSFKSIRLSDIWDIYHGDLIEFIRTCDLQCTLFSLRGLGWLYHYERAPLSSVVDYFKMSRYSTRIVPESLKSMDISENESFLQGQLRDMLGRALPSENPNFGHGQYKTLDKNIAANLESFDIPLYQWSMHCNLMALNLTLKTLRPPSGYSDLHLKLIREALPERASGFDLSITAYFILNARDWKSGSDSQKNNPALGTWKMGISMEKEIVATSSKHDEVIDCRQNDDAHVLSKRAFPHRRGQKVEDLGHIVHGESQISSTREPPSLKLSESHSVNQATGSEPWQHELYEGLAEDSTKTKLAAKPANTSIVNTTLEPTQYVEQDKSPFTTRTGFANVDRKPRIPPDRSTAEGVKAEDGNLSNNTSSATSNSKKDRISSRISRMFSGQKSRVRFKKPPPIHQIIPSDNQRKDQVEEFPSNDGVSSLAELSSKHTMFGGMGADGSTCDTTADPSSLKGEHLGNNSTIGGTFRNEQFGVLMDPDGTNTHRHYLQNITQQEKLSGLSHGLSADSYRKNSDEEQQLSLLSSYIDQFKRDGHKSVLNQNRGASSDPLKSAAPKEHSLEKYGEIKGIIGHGVFSTVHVAYKNDSKDPGRKQTYAIKEVRQRPQETRKKYQKRLTSEFCISSTVQHPNVIKTFDLIQDSQGNFCQIMEYCAGGDLYTLILASGKLTSDESDCFFKQLIRGIEYLHEMGVAHRDLNLENILLTAHGALKIADFGNSECVRMAWEQESRLMSGLCGSPPYIAPEAYSKEKFDGYAADMWATGLIYMAMRTGHHLWKISGQEDRFYKQYLEGRRTQDGYAPIETLHRARCRNVIYAILDPNPSHRITASQVIKTEWVHQIKLCAAGEGHSK